MAASKSKKTTKTKKGKTAPRKRGDGFVAFLRSKRFAHIRGALYVLFSIFLVIAMVGYYATTGRGGWLGAAGHGVAEFFTTNLFGLGSLGFALLFFVYGMRLWDVVVMPWWKTFGSTLFWMLWLSLTLGFISEWVDSGNFESYAGIIGVQMSEPLHRWLSWWTLVILLFLAVLFLVLVHKMELPEVKLPEVKLPKVDMKKAVQAVERELVDVATDHTEAESGERKVEGGEPKVESGEALFDEEAMKLFQQPAEIDLPVDEEPAFSIDDEFARINAKAQGQSPEEITFTIDENGDASDNSESSEESEDTEEAEELEPDDYRQHYGLDEPYDPHLDLRDYQMPQTDLLEDSEVKNVKVSKEELIANKDRIVQTLNDYGIEITEITATPGPTVTLYKIKPAPGVRISKIKGLENDIALSLAALGIRIIAPIPGESNIGIEVPNAKPQIVSMKTMLESPAFTDAKMELPVAFGKTISNEPFVTDLAKMPHLLMAGATGTGKSVGLNAVLASLLYKKHPSELKLVLVDPKKVEFSLYSALDRHYLAKMPDEEEAVITDVKKVVRTLNSLCIEMDSRYDLLKQAKVRKITEYNEKF